MVYYSERANKDLYNILVGLANWEKHPLGFNHALSYYDDIRNVCDSLDSKIYHVNAQYQTHKQFGGKVYLYTRNKNTTWYIIYDYDELNNIIYIQHITSNHTTKNDETY